MKKQSILVASLVMGLALPASAQDGFRVGLQVGSMKSTGNVAPFATVTGPSTLDTTGFDQATQTPYALDFAIVKGDNEWSLTYFNTKKKNSQTRVDAVNGVRIGDGFGFGPASPGITGSQELKATMIDVAWKRTLIKGDLGTFALSTGLRYSKQSDERSYQQTDAALNPVPGKAHLKTEGTGFGLTTGLHGRMNFTDRVWLTSGFTAALINNTAKNDDYSFQSGGPVVVFHNPDAHQSLLQTDAYLRLNVNFVKGFDAYLGYEVRDFNRDGARSYANGYATLITGMDNTSGFGLSGLALGLSYTF